MAEPIWNFTPRKDDIWILTYPKCGTTLTAEILWQIAHGVQLDSEESKIQILMRSPWIEISAISFAPPTSDAPVDDLTRLMQDSVTVTDQAKSPRIIKTHLPMAMLPAKILETAKVLYIGR